MVEVLESSDPIVKMGGLRHPFAKHPGATSVSGDRTCHPKFTLPQKTINEQTSLRFVRALGLIEKTNSL